MLTAHSQGLTLLHQTSPPFHIPMIPSTYHCNVHYCEQAHKGHKRLQIKGMQCTPSLPHPQNAPVHVYQTHFEFLNFIPRFQHLDSRIHEAHVHVGQDRGASTVLKRDLPLSKGPVHTYSTCLHNTRPTCTCTCTCV